MFLWVAGGLGVCGLIWAGRWVLIARGKLTPCRTPGSVTISRCSYCGDLVQIVSLDGFDVACDFVDAAPAGHWTIRLHVCELPRHLSESPPTRMSRGSDSPRHWREKVLMPPNEVVR